jgi:proteasome lid subunit RPN8/RPN11
MTSSPLRGAASRPAVRTLSRGGRTPTLPVHPPPVEQSILWRPGSDPAGSAAGAPADVPVSLVDQPVFITQGALRDVGHHVWASPDHDVLGFLLGARYEAPETGMRFVLVTTTTRSAYVISEEGEEQIPEDAWHAAHLEARRRRLTLLGWYHSAPFLTARPLPRDARSQQRFFPELWHVGMVAAPRAEVPAGGIFRVDSSAGQGWFLPFYEVTDDDVFFSQGQKRTVMPWHNYVTDDTPVRTTKVAAVRPRIAATGGAIPILMPTGRLEEQRDGKRHPKPSLKMSDRRRRERRKRLAIVAATMVGLLGVLTAALLRLR